MAPVVRDHPDTHLVICGTGALLPDLQAVARSAGVERYVTFAGLVDNARVAQLLRGGGPVPAAVAARSAADGRGRGAGRGTPVISSDNPGGVELHGVFGDDVQVVPKEQPQPLARAISAALSSKRRTRPSTQAIVEQRFRADAVARQYWDIYASVIGTRLKCT